MAYSYQRPRPQGKLCRSTIRAESVEMIDRDVPTARILRLRAANPLFVSRRQGWARFYRDDARFTQILVLRNRLDKHLAARGN